MAPVRDPGNSSRLARLWVADHGDPRGALALMDARRARATLSSRAGHRLAEFERALTASWLAPVPHLAAASALASLGISERVGLHPGSADGGPRWFAQSLTCAQPAQVRLRNHDQLGSSRQYELEGPDPFANRPVSLGALVSHSDSADRAIEAIEAVLDPNDAGRQLRMVLYDGPRATLYAGLYRRRRDPAFRAADHALLLAARSPLRSWIRVATAVGVAPIGDGALPAVLEAVGRPALLLRRGRIVWANGLGQAMASSVGAWLRAGRPAGYATVTPLRPGGLEVDLVLPTRLDPVAVFASLPPALRPVAQGLLEGLTDKEIAMRLSAPLWTVRTYVARVRARLGAASRRDLIGMARGLP